MAYSAMAQSAGEVHLDLGSPTTGLNAANVFEQGTVYNIDVNGTPTPITHESDLTAAEYVAAVQVATTGSQSIVIGQDRTASGGSFVASALTQNTALSGLVVPTGVTAIHDFGTGSALNLTGNLVNSGNLYAVSTDARTAAGTFSANNIVNNPGALLTSVLPTGGLSGFSNLVSNFSFTLTAVNDVLNYGTISSAGALNISAGNSIINGVSPTTNSVAAATTSLQAATTVNLTSNIISNYGQISSLMNDVNLITNNLTNSGVLQAMQGSIDVQGLLGNTLNILNTNGVISARDSVAFTVGGNSTANILNLTGGSVTANAVTLDAGRGAINFDVVNVSNGVDVNADVVNLSVSNGTSGLDVVGLHTVTGGSLSYAGLGDVSFRRFSTDGGSVSVNTTGNINVTQGNNSGDINTVGSAGTGNVSLITTAGNIALGDIFARNVTLVAGGAVDVNGNINANGGSLTLGGATTNVTGNVDIGEGSVNWQIPTNGQYVVDFNLLTRYGGSSISLGNVSGYTTDIILTDNCNGCLGNVNSVTFNTGGRYIATGTTLTLGNDTAFSVTANGGINTGAVSAGSVAFTTQGILAVDGNLGSASSLALNGGDITVNANQTLTANGGNLWLNAANDITVNEGTALASYATADGSSGGRIGLMSGAQQTDMNALLGNLNASRTGAEILRLPAGNAFDTTTNTINSTGGSIMEVVFPSFASKSVTDSTFNLTGGVIFIDPPGTNNVNINGANFIAVGPQLAPPPDPGNTGNPGNPGNTGNTGNTGGTGNTGNPAGGIVLPTLSTIPALPTPDGATTGTTGVPSTTTAANTISSSSANTLLTGVVSQNVASTTNSTNNTANTNLPRISINTPSLPKDGTDRTSENNSMRAAIYCAPPGKLQERDTLGDEDWIIASNKCQPFSFETADGSIVIGTGPAIFAPTNNRTLLLKEGKLLVISGDAMIVVRTPMCNVTIPMNSAATVEFSQAGLTRLTGLAGGKTSVSVTRQGETIILSAAAGEQLILAEDSVPDSEIQCVPDVPNKKNVSWLVRLSGLRGEKFIFDRTEMVSREGLLNCTLGCFTKLQQTMIDQIRKSMLLESPKELKSVLPVNKKYLASKGSNKTHLSAVGFGEILDLTVPDVISMKSGSAMVKYTTANISIVGPNKLDLRSGDALISTSAPTTLAAGKYTINIAPHTVAMVSNRNDHVVVRNVYESKLTGIHVITPDNKCIGAQVGQEVIVGKTSMSYTQVLNADAVGRRRMRHSDLGKSTSIISSEVSLISLLQNTNILSQMTRSVHPDDKAILNKVMKMAVALSITTQKHGNFSIVGH